MSPEENRNRLIKLYVEKSAATFQDARILANNSRWGSCINRLYYACFYVVYALLAKTLDIRTKTHSGVKTLFSEHFVKTGIVDVKFSHFYSQLLRKREESDYDDDGFVAAEDVLPLISQTEEFIQTIQKLIL